MMISITGMFSSALAASPTALAKCVPPILKQIQESQKTKPFDRTPPPPATAAGISQAEQTNRKSSLPASLSCTGSTAVPPPMENNAPRLSSPKPSVGGKLTQLQYPTFFSILIEYLECIAHANCALHICAADDENNELRHFH